LFYDLRFSEDEMRGIEGWILSFQLVTSYDYVGEEEMRGIEGWVLSFQLATSYDRVMSSAVTGNERTQQIPMSKGFHEDLSSTC
jgi:hypothetical protein